MRLYETMFLVNGARAKENVEPLVAELTEMVARTGGEVVNCDKWEERKLAYQIAHQRRGVYVLCHWNGPPDAPAKLERACRLSEAVLRVLTVVDEDGIEMPKPREEVPFRREGAGGWDGGGARKRGGRPWRT